MADDARLGTTLSGKYLIERVLGEGGMGIVYAARHLRIDRPVAIKFLHASYAKNESALDRFFVEARAAGSLRHPNVVDVSDLDTDGQAPFMVLELLEGESLAALLARRRRLPIDEALAIVLPVLDALAAAQARGIVHRDIKPDNVFLAREAGRVVPKLLDFGIAKLRDGSSVSTNTGTAMGTPMYMSPEQARGAVRDIGPASDVWAMGALLFECLTGALPFAFDAEAGPYALVALVATGRPRKLAELMPDAPDALAAAVDGALEPELARRLPSAVAMRAVLLGEPASAISPVGATLPATPASLPPTRVGTAQPASARPRVLGGAVALGLVVLVLGIVGWALTRPTPAPAPSSPVRADVGRTAMPTPQASSAPVAQDPASDPEVPLPAEAPSAPAPRAVRRTPTEHTSRAEVLTPPPAGPRDRAETRTGTWNPDDL